MISIENFIKQYSKQILDGNAAIFAGAGMSAASGYVSWRELLKDIAEELNLDIEKENDLIGIAQYHLNENNNRSALNQRILEKFTSTATESNVHHILARMPIGTYWTTNYDQIIEDVIKKYNKRVDIKIQQNSLANNILKRDVVVYKMHGDVLMPSEAVITKDDYEGYNEKHQLFTTALQGDLITKTFLFIGFSFEDPNLNYILSRIRILLGENKRTHYAFIKKCKREDYEYPEEYEYDLNRQKLKINDLNRYSICAIMINEYSEIENILLKIENKINKRNIFISGSACDYGVFGIEKATRLLEKITEQILKNDYKIVTGFGLGVGSFIINKAIQIIKKFKYSHFDEYINISPFPYQIGEKEKEIFNKEYRENMINSCGIAIFVFGNKYKDGEIVNSKGVMEEFNIAKSREAVIIPIGSTGFASKDISDEIIGNIEKYPYLKKYIKVLSESDDIEKIVDTIISIIENVNKDKK